MIGLVRMVVVVIDLVLCRYRGLVRLTVCVSVERLFMFLFFVSVFLGSVPGLRAIAGGQHDVVSWWRH